LGTVKAAISVMVGESVDWVALLSEDAVAVGEESVPFWVWKSVTSGSRRL
jgi:hypothetical protein